MTLSEIYDLQRRMDEAHDRVTKAQAAVRAAERANVDTATQRTLDDARSALARAETDRMLVFASVQRSLTNPQQETPTMSSPSPIAPVSYAVKIISDNDGLILIGPFASEEAAEAWMDAMPDDEDAISVDVVAMAGPTRNDGEPNY